MPEALPPDPTQIPAYLQALLNIIAFLISATAVWYAYFIKGKSQASPSQGTPNSSLVFEVEMVRRISRDLNRMAESMEEMLNLMKKGEVEAEIERRVRQELKRREHEDD